MVRHKKSRLRPLSRGKKRLTNQTRQPPGFWICFSCFLFDFPPRKNKWAPSSQPWAEPGSALRCAGDGELDRRESGRRLGSTKQTGRGGVS